MKNTITLNGPKVYEKNSTSKYWRKIQCEPQTVELKTWSSNHPYFILNGIVIDSHDEKEIGKEMKVHNQSYSFWIEDMVKEGIYTINN